MEEYRYCAADKSGDAVDFLLVAKRDLAAARRYPAWRSDYLVVACEIFVMKRYATEPIGPQSLPFLQKAELYALYHSDFGHDSSSAERPIRDLN